MGETTGQIETHIRNTRDDLSANLSELEHKVKSAADWRQQYQKSPGTFLAVAAGAGLLLALLTKGRGAPSPGVPQSTGPVTTTPLGRPKTAGPFDESLSEIKAALIGVAASHAKDVLSKLLPGFEQQLAEPKTNPPGPEQVRPAGAPLPH